LIEPPRRILGIITQGDDGRNTGFIWFLPDTKEGKRRARGLQRMHNAIAGFYSADLLMNRPCETPKAPRIIVTVTTIIIIIINVIIG
jgi:hypothetical protein